jgi:Calcineurin-like phosphoesterase
MRNRRAEFGLSVLIVTCSLYFLTSCSKRSPSTRSTNIKCGESCSSYQHSDSLPDQPPQGAIRIAIGGDSRNDKSHVVSWAFKETRSRGAKAFFLGDLELTSAIDKRFLPQLTELADTPFYPAVGNHEIETFGIVRLPKSESLLNVKRFKEEFLTAAGVNLAPLADTVVYSVDLAGGIHLIALDNVSRKGEGFGAAQLAWLEQDLKTASSAKKIILVGMHKGLANNPVTSHAMDEDGVGAVNDSEAALALFRSYGVAMVFVSHSHMYAAYSQGESGPQVRLTGGMGAPLVKGLAEADGGFHHFLLVDVSPSNSKAPVLVQVVKFPCRPPCTPSRSDTDESQEID